MEYSALAKLPNTSRKRLARAALNSLAAATIFVPILEFAVTDPAAGRSPWWFTGVALWFCSLAILTTCVLIGGRISRAVSFYLLEEAAVLPGMLVMFFGGIWTLREELGPSSATVFALGLGAGFVALPFAIRLRSRWMREAIARGHLSKALNPETATWDPRYDADDVLKDHRLRRPNRLLSLLFWAGPAVGLALLDIFGRLTATVIMGIVLAAFGYFVLVAGLTKLGVTLLELRRFGRSLGRRILLPAEFSRGEQPQAR
jgi:hypothetical protein